MPTMTTLYVISHFPPKPTSKVPDYITLHKSKTMGSIQRFDNLTDTYDFALDQAHAFIYGIETVQDYLCQVYYEDKADSGLLLDPKNKPKSNPKPNIAK